MNTSRILLAAPGAELCWERFWGRFMAACSCSVLQSGLTKAVKESKISLQQAEYEFLSFVRQQTPPGLCPLAGEVWWLLLIPVSHVVIGAGELSADGNPYPSDVSSKRNSVFSHRVCRTKRQI